MFEISTRSMSPVFNQHGGGTQSLSAIAAPESSQTGVVTCGDESSPRKVAGCSTVPVILKIGNMVTWFDAKEELARRYSTFHSIQRLIDDLDWTDSGPRRMDVLRELSVVNECAREGDVL